MVCDRHVTSKLVTLLSESLKVLPRVCVSVGWSREEGVSDSIPNCMVQDPKGLQVWTELYDGSVSTVLTARFAQSVYTWNTSCCVADMCVASL